jgi:molybdate transport system ATP-binding protein
VLSAELQSRRGSFSLEVALTVPAGRTLVLAGESGAGKTTILRLLAGLDTPRAGRVVLNGQPLLDTARGAFLPAWKRPVGYVAQDDALFPHLTVRENVAFGLRSEGRPAREIRSRVGAMLERLGLEGLAERRPAELSGGERQRTALARALVLEPALLLLDEPLSALDLRTRDAVRAGLRRLLAELPGVTLYVTHQPAEALLFGDEIAVLEQGRITQSGTGDELLRRPRSEYVATFVGLNLLRGRVSGPGEGGITRVETADGVVRVAGSLGEGAVFLAVSPREITLSRERPEGTAQNLYQGVVRELVPEPPFGDRVRVALETHPPLVAEVTRGAVAALGLVEGDRVWAAFKATGVVAYPGG